MEEEEEEVVVEEEPTRFRSIVIMMTITLFHSFCSLVAAQMIIVELFSLNRVYATSETVFFRPLSNASPLHILLLLLLHLSNPIISKSKADLFDREKCRERRSVLPTGNHE